MSILTSLLEQIFSHPAAAPGQPSGPAEPPAPSAPAPEASVPAPEASAPAPEASGPPTPAASVDIEKVMDAMVAEHGEKLDWRHSVVDLLKAVGLDSGRQARLRLADELHYDGPRDTAAMNEWLHDAVLKAIAENGGKLPEGL